ncbi:PilZ domain-containing protein [Pseudomonas flavescens]|uniref:PilZ domain-containing protein n=1 Tax=Phytopseudomonas flavescens TaxID=29435 RepID=A0A1G7YS08_9GAMM|nr:PilZ domain-containing protein [Pseudomonas flavescens]SDG99241.1 PilZ domain-containing protein [Pseudomonas flavescens]
MRRFLRHSSDLPVELRLRRQTPSALQRLDNIGLGGAACYSPRALSRGSAVELHIPLLGERACHPGLVAWCCKQSEAYLVGIAFAGHDAGLRTYMVEQVCRIEQYRRHREQQVGHALPLELIAGEWQEQHASTFKAPTS